MTRRELLRQLQGADDQALFAAARRERTRTYGDAVFLRGIVEFSNHCQGRCRYCGLREGNTGLRRYRLQPREILDAAAQAPGLGLGTVVLQSGEDPFYDMRVVGELVAAIKGLGLAVTLSLGERSFEELQHWRQCGADRYLLKFETSNPALHAQHRPGRSLARRLECFENLQRLGYEAGAGMIVGLPGQSLEDLADDLLLLERLQPAMASAGPFLPHPDTPLAGQPAGDVNLSLRTMALMRLLLPRVNMPATSALEVATPQGRLLGLQAGANVIMPAITPPLVRAGYAIYPGKNAAPEDIAALVASAKTTIRQAGLTPSTAPGFAARARPPEESRHV